MACINKSDKKYKALQERYGDTLAASYVRGNVLNKRLSSPEDFYIPTIEELSDYFKNVRKPLKVKEVQDALRLNPLLETEAIKSILKRVIHKHKGALYITRKGSSETSAIFEELVLKEVFEPNLEIMTELAEQYPDIFNLVPKRGNPTIVRVEITPATTAEYVPEIDSSVRTYNNFLVNNGGIQPNSFVEGDHVWQRVGNHVYTLIDANTGDPFLRNMNLLSGTEVTPSLFPVNKQDAEAEIADIRTNYDNEYWQVDLALRGYDLDLIITNLENAETQQEFDELLANFKKLTC